MEHLAVSKARMKYLMLVKVVDDTSLMKVKATKVDFHQALPRTTISGQGYYTLKCSVANTRFRDFLISSKKSELYDKTQFESDFNDSHGGFSLLYADTAISIPCLV